MPDQSRKVLEDISKKIYNAVFGSDISGKAENTGKRRISVRIS